MSKFSQEWARNIEKDCKEMVDLYRHSRREREHETTYGRISDCMDRVLCNFMLNVRAFVEEAQNEIDGAP